MMEYSSHSLMSTLQRPLYCLESYSGDLYIESPFANMTGKDNDGSHIIRVFFEEEQAHNYKDIVKEIENVEFRVVNYTYDTLLPKTMKSHFDNDENGNGVLKVDLCSLLNKDEWPQYMATVIDIKRGQGNVKN